MGWISLPPRSHCTADWLPHPCLASLWSSQAWFPWLFAIGDDEAIAGSGRYVVAICFAIEHAIILLALVVNQLIPDEPEWVSDEMARLEYEKDKASRELRKEESLKKHTRSPEKKKHK